MCFPNPQVQQCLMLLLGRWKYFFLSLSHRTVETVGMLAVSSPCSHRHLWLLPRSETQIPALWDSRDLCRVSSQRKNGNTWEHLCPRAVASLSPFALPFSPASSHFLYAFVCLSLSGYAYVYKHHSMCSPKSLI